MSPLLLSPGFLAIFAPAVAKVYIVSFRTHDDRRPSKFIVLADSTKSAIKTAWEHGGADFQSRFDKSTGSPRDERRGATRSVRRWNGQKINPLRAGARLVNHLRGHVSQSVNLFYYWPIVSRGILAGEFFPYS
jgi:hypothetical protein